MAFIPVEGYITQQEINVTDTVQNHPLGTVIKAVENSNVGGSPLGEGEFIYLKGVASTIVGSVVIYDQRAGTTTLTATASRGPVAIAQSANVANQFGWYQISGSAVVKTAAAVAANAMAYATATAGQADDAVVAGAKIDGATYRTADGTPSAGFAIVQLAGPCLNGNG